MSNTTKNVTKPRVRWSQLGMFIDLVEQEYNCKTDKELAEVISAEFEVECTENDITAFFESTYESEDKKIMIKNIGIYY